ncbi:MAG TPA: 4-hydroxythreonine-4-phosphate dehydrogenase PdxA [Verrucomicrobiales bacterium]|nr:4-hydroxythreonine-4-phosphate dehydrogenase PdxA [Verrucomicrobiales bacterium]
MSGSPRAIGITLGDAAGIGPEVTAAALASGELDGRFDYRVIGACPSAQPGRPDATTARAALEALEESVRLLRAGEIAAVVTAPVCKASIAAQGFAFPGQTEFYADRLGVQDFVMCLTGPHLTVGLVTIHEPLRRVPELINQEAIVRTGRLLEEFVRRRGIARPRLAVAGLNPHAGEDGHMGTEDGTIILPAVEELRRLLPQAEFSAPLPPDTLFYQAARGAWDAVVCMYHDQGLIPLKLLDFDCAVNVTLGLPFVRTSPDHGTAFDIAGAGKASAQSMIAAINLAAELTQGS